jgi:hypothetical protein
MTLTSRSTYQALPAGVQGRALQLRIGMAHCDLYSFQFQCLRAA